MGGRYTFPLILIAGTVLLLGMCFPDRGPSLQGEVRFVEIGRIVVKCFGQVCVGGYDRDCREYSGVQVSLLNSIYDKGIPVDYTNRRGEFFVDDELRYGYGLVVADKVMSTSEAIASIGTDAIIIGSSDIEIFLRFSEGGREDLYLDLNDLRKGDIIDCATPIQVIMPSMAREEKSVTQPHFFDQTEY